MEMDEIKEMQRDRRMVGGHGGSQALGEGQIAFEPRHEEQSMPQSIQNMGQGLHLGSIEHSDNLGTPTQPGSQKMYHGHNGLAQYASNAQSTQDLSLGAATGQGGSSHVRLPPVAGSPPWQPLGADSSLQTLPPAPAGILQSPSARAMLNQKGTSPVNYIFSKLNRSGNRGANRRMMDNETAGQFVAGAGDGAMTQIHPSTTSLGLANIGDRSNIGSGLIGLDDPSWSQAGGIFTRNRKNVSTLDPAALSLVTAASGKSEIQKSAHSSSLGPKKQSLTPAKRRVPKIHVGPGAITVLSGKFAMERQILEFKRDKHLSKLDRLRGRNASVASPHGHPGVLGSSPPNEAKFAFGVGSSSLAGADQGLAQSSGLSPSMRNDGALASDTLDEDMERLIEIYLMESQAVKDLTSRALSKQKGEKVLKEDIEEQEALEKFKASLIHKYPGGKIPKKKLDEFHTSRKLAQFRKFLKSGAFAVVFRDAEFMAALDQATAEKQSFEASKARFLPEIHVAQGREFTLKSPHISKLEERLRTNKQKRLNAESYPGNPNLKFGKGMNTLRMQFEAEEFFWKNKIQVFSDVVKGGGGALALMAKEAREAALNPQKKRTRTDSVAAPTLDRKGRINENMYHLYPGLYNSIKAAKIGSAGSREDQKAIDAKVANIFNEFEHKRAPQSASRSLSPYLLASSYNFDVTEILQDVKRARDKRLLYEKYSQMTQRELHGILTRHERDTKLKQSGRPGLNASEFDGDQEKITPEVEQVIREIQAERDAARGNKPFDPEGEGEQSGMEQEQPRPKKTSFQQDQLKGWMLGEIQRFAVQAVQALDATSTYRIRGEQLDEAEEQLLKDVEELNAQEAFSELALQVRSAHQGQSKGSDGNADLESATDDSPGRGSERDTRSRHDQTTEHGTQMRTETEFLTSARQSQATQMTRTTRVTGTGRGQREGADRRKAAQEEDQEEKKFSAMKITTSIRQRHKGLLEEIQKEIRTGETFLQGSMSDRERLRLRQEMRQQEKGSKLQIKLKVLNDLKDFKRSKQSLIKQLVGTGSKKEKVKDMSLGSAAAVHTGETRQNERVLGRLIADAQDMNKKIEDIGLPMDAIQEEYLGKKKSKESASGSPSLARGSHSKLSSSLRKLPAGEPGPKTELKINTDLVGDDLQEQHRFIGREEASPAEGVPSPEALSPIKSMRRATYTKALAKRLAAAAFPAYDSDDPLTGEAPVQDGIAYLPSPRSKDNPNARGGAIQIQPLAPNARLDSTLNFDRLSRKHAKFRLLDLLVSLGIEEAPQPGDGKPITIKTVSQAKVEECLRSVIKVSSLREKPIEELTPGDWLELSQNRIMRLYFQEMIERGCQDVIHSRITSDTMKMRHFELAEKLKLLEDRLYEEASGLNINVGNLRRQVLREMVSPAKKKGGERSKATGQPGAEQEAESGSNASEIADEPILLDEQGGLEHTSRVAIPHKKAPQVSALVKRSVMAERAVDLALSKESEEVQRTEQMTHFDLSRRIEDGLIDKERCLNFNVDEYFDMILYKKSGKEVENELRAQQHHHRTVERKNKNKLPWEKAASLAKPPGAGADTNSDK